MAKEDATATRLKNIEIELQSMTTCTAATVAELQNLLSGDTTQSQKENLRVKNARGPSAQTTARRRPGTANASKAEHDLSPRQRYILATQTVNATLKSLTDALKIPVTQRTAKSPPASKPPPNVATNAPKPHAKSTSVSSHPLKERPVSQATNSSARPKALRRSSSYPTFTNPDASLIATAECARLGFAYLSTSEGARFVGNNTPDLALENGRLSLVGKLVTHGLDSLAVKEMRLLKKRLNMHTLRNNEREESRPAAGRSTSQQVPPSEKESLAALLDFGDVDRANAAIPIIINLQIYALRVIGRLKRPRHVEAVWNYLKLSHPSNPTGLILHTAKEKAQQPKAARQLESLAQTILNLCPSISPSADDEQPQPSPDIVLCLQHLAFGIRQQWWALAQHQGDKHKDLIEPFGKCLVAFTRRSTLSAAKQYKLAESLYSNLLGTGKTTDFAQRDGKGLPENNNLTLASLARAAGLPDEAFRWLGSNSSSIMKESSAAIAVRSVRVAALSLEAFLKGSSKPDQEATIDTALEMLSGSLDGTGRDLETLLLEVHALRRIASRILSSIASADDARWSPTLREQLPLTSIAAWEELDALIQDCVRFISQLEEESVNNDDASFTLQEGTQSVFVKFSNSYWALRRQLQKLDSDSAPDITAMQRSIALLHSRPQAEKEAGQLTLKLERLGEELERLDRVQESREAYAECIRISLNDDLCEAIVEAACNYPIVHVFKTNPSIIDLGRVLRLYHRSFTKHGLSKSDELAFFDSFEHTILVRGALLEWQLGMYEQTLSKHRTWDVALNSSVQAMADRLVTIYTPEQFPVRQQRLHLLLLQLSQMYPNMISGAYTSEDHQPGCDVDINQTKDHNLSRFGDHLKAMIILKTLLHQGDLSLQKFRSCFSIWESILDTTTTWVEVEDQIDNTNNWLDAIQASVDFFCAKGEEYEALPVLHLLIRILELQAASDRSAMISALSTLGLQFLRLGYSGKAGLAFAKAGVLLNQTASVEAKLRWHIGYAEYLLIIGNASKCDSTLSAADTLARNNSTFTDLSKSSTSLSGRMIFNRIIAEACYVSSLRCSSKGDYKNAARHARQAVVLNRRIWAAREGNANTRKAVTANSSNLTEIPTSAHSDPSSSMRHERGAPLTSSITHEALKAPEFWSLVPSLYRALTQHSIVIARQGMLDEAVYVLQQAGKVASAVGSRTLVLDHTSRLADLWIQSGRPDKAQPLFDGLDVPQSAKHLSTVSYHLSLARMHHVRQRFDDEIAEYDVLEQLLQHLSSPSYIGSTIRFMPNLGVLTDNVSALTLEESKPAEVPQTRSVRTRITATKTTHKTLTRTTTRTTRKAPLRSEPTAIPSVLKKATTLPAHEIQSASEHCTSLDALQADILYRRVATYLLQSNVVEAMDLLSKVEKSELDREGSHAWVRFKAMLAQAIRSISNDFTFNTLPESTIAFPSIPPKERQSSEGVAAKRPAVKAFPKLPRGKKQAGDGFVKLIEDARERLVEAHAQHATTASNHVFRQLCAALSHATVLLSAVSQGRVRGSIHPLYSAYMSEIPKHHALASAQDSVEVDQETLSREVCLQWPTSIENESPTSSPAEFQHDYIDIIPETWTAVSLALSEEQDELYITRYQRNTSPFVLRLPLARQSSRDLDEEEFSFTDGRRELEEIIELSDFTTRNAKDLTSREGRKQWWEDRQALDTKLRELLHNIEKIWLGGFKGIFSDHIHQPALLARFRKSFDTILARHLPSRQKKSQQKRPNLDPRVLDLFIGLGNASDPELDLDEALTDLIYFVVDILQFNGEPNAYDEIDFDLMVVETYEALRAYHDSAQRASPASAHTILILDKNLHMLPWESLPCLEKLSVSRLPSLAALRERLLAARSPTATENAPAGHYISAEAGGTSMLNPSGDLGNTSKTIKPYLDDMQGTWTHIANRPPLEKEFEDCLKTDELVLFFGHGSGAQYIRSQAVRRLYLNGKAQSEGDKKKPGCATTFLFGCSSVHLSDNGIYEPSGMLSSYLTAGAPAVLGMLWDVTDKDCDRLAVRAGELWGLWPEPEPENEASVEPPPTIKKRKGKGRVAQLVEEVGTPRAASKSRKGNASADTSVMVGRRKRGIGLDEAVRDARNACVLRYLNGAAAVVYGIPVYLE
ncbi:separin protein [Paraconiothyrium brasiliense]|uniref:separase n=1 Tax=Paraconiothyrium brasiliense TaxID=300254 RepID=A0ABR3S7Q3_9PLEO